MGASKQLRQFGIDVVVDLPGVGENSHDHICVYVYATTKPSFTQFGSLPEGIAFVKTRPVLPKVDLQLMFAPLFVPPTVPGNGYTIAISLTDPQSRGRIALRSNTPTEYPAIFANYLAHQQDKEKLVEGIELVRRMNKTKALAPFYENDFYPDPHLQSEADLDEFVRNNALTLGHIVGTCKMGYDELAVVDEQLRVHGTQGLRVVDASIMPTIVSGNTNAPVIMVAEKIADLLKRVR